MTTLQQKPRVLVIGGGFAGVVMATKCRDFAEVTLVDPKSYFEITWATVRGIIDPTIAARACISYKDIPGIGTIINATVTSLSDKEATLSDGQVVPFDYAAICTGSAYSDAFKSNAAVSREQRLEELKSVGESIRAAKSIVVVGGGPSGVEAACEVAGAMAGKDITLVHPGGQLLPALPPKAGAKAQKWLETHGVKVVLGSKVAPKPEGSGPATLTLSGGATLAADLVLWCAGAVPNTAFLAEGLGGGCLDNKRLIKVLPTLQVEGHPHIFALGDCNNVAETKMGFLAMKQAELATASVRALIRAGSGKAPKLGTWTPSMGMPTMLVTLGPSDGIFRMGGLVLTGWLPAMIKSKGLFIDKTRSQLKIKPSAKPSAGACSC